MSRDRFGMDVRRFGLFALLVFAAACRDFEPIVEGLCGNGIVEPRANEYCDDPTGEGLTCGEPGTNEACQLVCPAPDGSCPDGWRCGVDHVCRAPSGAFEVRTVAPIQGTQLLAGDIDGDGYDDAVVLASTGLTVGYGGRLNPLASRSLTPIVATNGDAHLADLDVDGRLDVVVPTVLGVQMFRGSQTQRLLPVAIPFVEEAPESQVRVLPVVTSPSSRTHELVLARDGPALDLEVFGRPTTVAPEVTSASVGRPLLDRLAITDVVGSTVAVGEMALAGVGDQQVQVVRVECGDAPESECRIDLVQTVPVMGGAIGVGGTWVADLDGDGRTELVATVTFRDPMMNRMVLGLSVAERTPDGSFGALRRRPELDATARCFNCGVLDGEASLQHVVDLDQDGRADFVNRSGLYLSSSTDFRRPAPSAMPPWQNVTVTDLNEDGLLDVAATQPDAIDILLAFAPGRFNPLSAPTIVSPTQIVAGDFDGDLATDLAILESRQSVAVLFSGRQAVPTERVVMAELPGVIELERVRLGPDAIDDLVVTARDPAGGTDLLVRLVGDSSRRMASVIERIDGPSGPVAAGRFTGSRNEDVVIVQPPPLNMMVSMPGAIRLVSWDDDVGHSTITERTWPTEGDCALPAGGVLVASAHDLDGDGRDELVVHQTYKLDLGTMSTYRYPLIVYRFDDSGPVCVSRHELPAGAPASEVLVADLDGDGALDVAVSLSPADLMGGPPAIGDVAEIAVRWGDGRGGFVDGVDKFVVDPDPRGRFQLALVDADGDDAREIAYVGGRGVRYFDFVDRQTMRDRPVAMLEVEGRAIGGADVDGDGVGDILVATGQEVFVYRGQACSPDAASKGCQPADVPVQ